MLDIVEYCQQDSLLSASVFFDLFFEVDSDVSPCPCPQGLLKDQSKVLVLVLVTQDLVNITGSGTFCSNFDCSRKPWA